MSDLVSANNICTTSILLSNLHCPSCVRTISETLSDFSADIIDVSASTVSQTVTIKHTSNVAASLLAKALHGVGFDVQTVLEQRGQYQASAFSQRWSGAYNSESERPQRIFPLALSRLSRGFPPAPELDHVRKAKHAAHCQSCAATQGDHAGRFGSQERLTADQPESFDAMLTAGHSAPEPLDEKQFTKGITVQTSQVATEDKHRVVLSIGGMTCSACVGRVVEALEEKAFVETVNVNLITQSAVVIIFGREHAPELVEEVEDIGYEASVETCEPVLEYGDGSNRLPDPDPVDRTVMIKVEGFYCQHCPTKILGALEAFASQIIVNKSPTYADGLVEVTYQPQSSTFKLRDILQSIEAADRDFKARIYHPPSLEERAQRLQAHHKRRVALRLALSVVIAIPTFIIGVVCMSLLSTNHPLRQYFAEPASPGRVPRGEWALLVLATPVYLFAADLFHRRALKEVYMLWRPASKVPIMRRFYRFGSMDMLLSLGTTVAYVGSIAVIAVAASQTSLSESNTSGDTTTYFDAVVFLTMFLLMGRLLEAFGKAQTADAVSSLGKLRPKEALLLSGTACKTEDDRDPAMQRIAADQLDAGDIVSVPPGSSPPCDGVIVYGTSNFDESSLTGESKTVTKTVGEDVYAGTINLGSPVHVRITGFGGVSLLDRIVDVVREGQARRAPIEGVADVITSYFVPAITLLAVLDWIVWLAVGYAGRVPYVEVGTGSWSFWSLQFAIAILVVACPCGIGLAAPTALFVGTGIAAKHGILVKGGGEAFQDASGLDCVVFDKTGTITEGGNPVVTDHEYLFDADRDALLSAVRTLESNSGHPLARAIVGFCDAQHSLKSVETLHMEETAGKGMAGKFVIEETRVDVFIGNESLAQEHGAFMSPEATRMLQEWSSEGKTVVMIGVRTPTEDSGRSSSAGTWKLALVLAASDPIRPEAPAIIEALTTKGVDVWLLSGDNVTTARAVANKVGIKSEHVIAGVLPQGKAEKIQYLQKSLKKRKARYFGFGGSAETLDQRATVAMVGDGINDAPALAMADVGIAMGSGADTAISSADFVLISSDLNHVLLLVQLSKMVLRRVKFNFAWAMGYNLIMLPIAAGVLFPAVSNGSHIRLDPVWASLAMALSSVSVVTSSLLLRSNLPFIGFRA